MEYLNNNTSTSTDNKPIDEREKGRILEEVRDIMRRMVEAERNRPPCDPENCEIHKAAKALDLSLH
jgi:predicted neutral ceramidase superfamily lipid hydrolase